MADTGSKEATHSRLYHPPTKVEVEKYGPLIADARSTILAERRRSRIFSFGAALVTGTLITATKIIQTGDMRTQDIAACYIVPTIVNTVAQFRTERVQKRELGRYGEIALHIREEALALQIELASYRAKDAPLPPFILENQMQGTLF